MTPDPDLKKRIVVVAGMPRAATTFLYHTLANHPDAWVPSRKEVEYFSLNHYRGPEWYFSFFDGAAAGRVGFDISPIYFMEPDVPARIRDFNPDARVVILVRDPAEFVLSFYAQRLGTMYNSLSFEAFLSGYTYTKDGRDVDFVFDDGRIEETIERFRSTFGRNLLLCSYDVVREDPLPVLQAIEAFTGMSAYFTPDNFENVRVNASNQRNIVWLNRLMHYKWFADTVVRLVPKRLILAVRYWVQTRQKTTAQAPAGPGGDADRALAERHLQGDRRYVAALFRESGLVLGTGEPTTPQALRPPVIP